MAISKVIHAALIAAGEVRAVRDRSGEGKNGKWAFRVVTLEQRSGAQVDVVCWADDRGVFDIGNPAVGDFLVANVYINEAGREPDVRFHSWPFDALDMIQSNLAAQSKKAAA